MIVLSSSSQHIISSWKTRHKKKYFIIKRFTLKEAVLCFHYRVYRDHYVNLSFNDNKNINTSITTTTTTNNNKNNNNNNNMKSPIYLNAGT